MAVDWQHESKYADKSESDRRIDGMKYLFAGFGVDLERDPATMARARVMLIETQSIPFWFWRRAIRAVIASHKWANVPTVAEIRQAAEHIAGMDRERYHAGQYLPAERDFPADGLRYAVNAGELESADGAVLAIGPGELRPALQAGTPSDFTPLSDELGGVF